MAAPAGGVLAVPETFGLGGVQDLFDPAPHPRGGFGLRRPDRLQDRQHVIGGDGIHRLVAQRCGVGRQRRFPLRLVSLVPETRRQRLPHLIGHFAERGDAAGAFPLIDGVQALGDLPARAGGLLTGVGKGHRRSTSQVPFLLLAPAT